MKTMTLLLVLFSCVGYSHTDEEKRRYVNGILEGALYVASDDNWSVEGRDPDPGNVLSTWEGFLGRPGGNSWVSGWSLEERKAAFDWYLVTLSTTNCLVFSSMDKKKVLSAYARCKRLAYTNAVPMLRAAALNPNGIHRDLAIEIGVDFGDVGTQSTEFVETIVTNLSGYTMQERVMACGRYASKILSMSPTNSSEVAACDAAVRCLYENREACVVSANILDTLFVSKIEGYEYSSNRLEYAGFVLRHPGCRPSNVKKYSAVTNQLLSFGRSLQWINVGRTNE